MKKFKLFCLPHAGGNRYAYKKFADCAPAFLDVVLLEYAGRGEKIRQQPITDVLALAAAMAEEIKKQINVPFAIYGHSMGSLVGLLATRILRRDNVALPKFLFFTGSEGPSTRTHPRTRHLLPKPDLIEELRSLGGLSDEVLSHPDIFDFFETIIRADFQAIETYRYTPEPPLNIPITIAIGTQEEVTLTEARSWQQETREPLEVMQFSGRHFFIFSHVEKIMKLIGEKIMEEDYSTQ